MDKHEYRKVVQLVDGMNISGAVHGKFLECAPHTTDAKVNSVLTMFSRVMKLFQLLLALGFYEEKLCSFCI